VVVVAQLEVQEEAEEMVVLVMAVVCWQSYDFCKLTDGDGLQFLLPVHQGLLLAMIHQQTAHL
jgi:hypothetical protein